MGEGCEMHGGELRRNVVTLLILLALPACLLAQQPTPEEQQTITQLQGELAQIESEIESAEEDNRAERPEDARGRPRGGPAACAAFWGHPRAR